MPMWLLPFLFSVLENSRLFQGPRNGLGASERLLHSHQQFLWGGLRMMGSHPSHGPLAVHLAAGA